jgi:hypothetical protein
MAEVVDRSSKTIEPSEGDLDNLNERPYLSQHEHTDSMVTIRLSSNNQTENPPDVKEHEAEDESERTSNGMTLQFPDETEITENSSKTTDESPKTPSEVAENENKPMSKRISKVRFDMDKAVEGQLPKEEDIIYEPENVESPIQTPQSLMSPVIIEEGETLEAEMERHAAKERRNSSASSDSESAQVDWVVLDKNEEQEQRTEATDEVNCII